MQTVLALGTVAVVVTAWTALCLYLARWSASAACPTACPTAQRPGRRSGRRPTRGPVGRGGVRLAPDDLPEGHRPPPGLPPISPSERSLSQETARGIRELQQFLLDRAG